MKRYNSSDSLEALISVSSPKAKDNEISKSKQVYSREFQAMLDSLDKEDCLEEPGQYKSSEKKRRLRMDQVKALEKNFEVDNRLEPERKLKLAEELGLQPRQVAIWFQNRRARWKTKELEKDYALLKASFDALKSEYDKLEQEKEALTTELLELKAKVEEEKSESSQTAKEEPTKIIDSDENSNFGTLKDDSNASGQLLTSPASSSSLQFNASSSSSNSSVYWVRSFDPGMVAGNLYNQARLVKVIEQSALFNAEESTCNFFSVDQAPTLQWYFQGQ